MSTLTNVLPTGMLLYPMIALVAIMAIVVLCAIAFRIVVDTNSVHIVQTGKKTISYGKEKPGGNTYYRWPSWVPYFGVKVSVLPISVFKVELKEYPAYDKGRLPFILDILAFYRISDSNTAAERVYSVQELTEQLKGIMQGAVRSILAKAEIEEILGERAVFGQNFTDEVKHQLEAWGVEPVKNLELMDIRDAAGSTVIQNIMAKKESQIEMESRRTVAENTKLAETSEIEAQREVALRKAEAQETVGKREALMTQNVGIQTQQAHQNVAVEEKITAEKKMEVVKVNEVRKAEINKDVMVVRAEQDREVAIVNAEADKKQNIVVAEGHKEQSILVAAGKAEAQKLEAAGVEAMGEAKGKAETAILMAPVNAQMTLAKEIGANDKYQKYLVEVRTVEANEHIGVAQAGALEKADIKVVATAGDPSTGLGNVRELFSAKGGATLGAALEAFMATEAGKNLFGKVIEGSAKSK